MSGKKRPAERIMDGLRDAVAFARGDTSRGTLISFVVRDGKAVRLRSRPDLKLVPEEGAERRP